MKGKPICSSYRKTTPDPIIQSPAQVMNQGWTHLASSGLGFWVSGLGFTYYIRKPKKFIKFSSWRSKAHVGTGLGDDDALGGVGQPGGKGERSHPRAHALLHGAAERDLGALLHHLSQNLHGVHELLRGRGGRRGLRTVGRGTRVRLVYLKPLRQVRTAMWRALTSKGASTQRVTYELSARSGPCFSLSRQRNEQGGRQLNSPVILVTSPTFLKGPCYTH